MTRGLASHRGAPVTSPATVVPASHSACVALSGWGTRRQKRRKRFVEGTCPGTGRAGGRRGQRCGGVATPAARGMGVGHTSTYSVR